MCFGPDALVVMKTQAGNAAAERENTALLQDVCFTPLHVFSSLLLDIGSGCGFFLFIFKFLLKVPTTPAYYPLPFPFTLSLSLARLIIKSYFKGLEYNIMYFIPPQNVNMSI